MPSLETDLYFCVQPWFIFTFLSLIVPSYRVSPPPRVCFNEKIRVKGNIRSRVLG